MMMDTHEPDQLPPQLARWLSWPVTIVGASALAVGLFVGLVVGLSLGTAPRLLSRGYADPLPQDKIDAFNHAFGHVDLSDTATLASRLGDMVTVHGIIDARRDENGKTALMLTGSTVPLVFKKTLPAGIVKGMAVVIHGCVEKVKGGSGKLALADCELVR